MRVDMRTRHCKLRVALLHNHPSTEHSDASYKYEYEKQAYVHVGSEGNRQYYGK